MVDLRGLIGPGAPGRGGDRHGRDVAGSCRGRLWPVTGWPRFALAVLPTPLHEAPRLAEAIGVRGRLLVKRDDLTGFAVAGNKARPWSSCSRRP